MRGRLVVVLFCVVLCLSLSQASARLGETMEQCQARYGPSVPSLLSPQLNNFGVTSHTYRVGVYNVSITFYDNVALTISYSRLDSYSLTDDEIQHMLSINSQSSHWTIATGVFPSEYDLLKQWKRDDGAAIAGSSKNYRYFNVQSTKLNDAIAAVKARAKNFKLQQTQDSLNKL